ncbi:MAG: TRAP transporter substrate-binding protein [Rhodospirillales bacterium]|nr:MAG: TRAP transporter substrate-binding protein [Rhodospirillales bacterium]
MAAIEMRFGGYQGPASVHSRALELLKGEIEARLDAAVAIEIDGNIVASGKNAADLLTMVDSGALTMCYFSTSYLGERVPAFAVLDLPFLVRDRNKAYAALDGPLGHLLTERLAGCSNYRVLGYWDNGFRHFSNGVRPIRTPKDCRGLRIRNLSSELHARTFEMLGFEPITLDVRELVPAVQQGRVDAQDNPLTNIRNFGLLAYHRWITLTGHFFGSAALLCHGPSYHSWPGEIRAAVDIAAAIATESQREFATAEDTAVLAEIDPERNEIIHLTGAERAAFADAVEPLVEEQRRRLGPELIGYLE